MAPQIDTLGPADDHPKAAPGDLNHIRRFVNTLDLDDKSDQIADPETLRDWFAERGLIDDRVELSPADVRQAHSVREALRKLLLANNGDPLDPSAVETLNAAAKSAELQLHIAPDGSGELSPCRTGVDGAIGRLLAIVHTAMANGTWERLKACALHDTCEWAFYDWTKNRSGTWCDMKVCGNRSKARAFRARHKAAGADVSDDD
jgi:predicted RNA-binding Zn ribbon-like protein